ncbi:hypothetical protein ACFLU8_02365 [Chloroflexota bacterium]
MVILILICLGGYVVYNVVYAKGEVTGHDKGYNAGYSLGQQVGYDEGHAFVKAEGFNEGVGTSLGHGYALRDPTYRETVKFIEQDKTKKNEFVENTYVCSLFARGVCNSAEDEGLRCAFVEIRYAEGGHAVVASNTIDEGLVYFDPQGDERVLPVIGKRYYQCIEPSPGYHL